MPTISLCLIVKNEEETLAKCLQSVHNIADEIIVVDTGSTDATKDVAKRFTNQIYDFTWIDDFSAARNFAFQKASMDYIMWLDADDILLPDDRVRLIELKKTLDPSVDVVMMLYHVKFDMDGNPLFSYHRERLVKRSRHFAWVEPVHEYIPVSGNVRTTEIAVTHTKLHAAATGRNLAIYEKMRKSGRSLTPRGLYYYARELKDNGKNVEAAQMFLNFLESGSGWVEDNISACLELAACYQLRHLPEKQVLSLLHSFLYDTPRAEACCQLGYFYKNQNNFSRALFWFQLATTLHKPEKSWGFFQPDCWGYTPHLELAVCYDRLGRRDEAERHNEIAAQYKPNAAAVLYNRKYFHSLTKAKKPVSPSDKKTHEGETT
ncbi:glycosyltransferase [Ethanoligenens sp.]|uniref:glycosyltransferase n=1 Tax=Ethanoligenens sp. TaxID=2099655 RepID=UPI0039EA45C5